MSCESTGALFWKIQFSGSSAWKWVSGSHLKRKLPWKLISGGILKRKLPWKWVSRGHLKRKLPWKWVYRGHLDEAPMEMGFPKPIVVPLKKSKNINWFFRVKIWSISILKWSLFSQLLRRPLFGVLGVPKPWELSPIVLGGQLGYLKRKLPWKWPSKTKAPMKIGHLN